VEGDAPKNLSESSCGQHLSVSILTNSTVKEPFQYFRDGQRYGCKPWACGQRLFQLQHLHNLKNF
jgi:hypothetical protein